MAPSSDPRYPRKSIDVLGHRMTYVDVGNGDPIVFLHGNPTSSYMWRNVMPYLEGAGRLIAPDLIGMGDSDKLPGQGDDRYALAEHGRYLGKLFELLGVTERVTFVLHDWGCALGFDWANRHRQAIKGIAYMEAIVQPLTWADWPEEHVATFQALRSPAGDQMILEDNMMVDVLIPEIVVRKLTDEEFAHYRRPYVASGEARRPTLSWARQIPIEGEPADVVDVVTAYGKWLSVSFEVPKLFINSENPDVLKGASRDFCRTWPNQIEITVPGIHFLHEDSPDAIGEALASWYRGI
ncbi:Pimeloyl-ACP methyl ester carboxylesterase [Burkholderia sp. OK233]|nr:Pimeloyl-ACP methyl ester carboxylesterase [Burkholderia sp. OK233]